MCIILKGYATKMLNMHTLVCLVLFIRVYFYIKFHSNYTVNILGMVYGIVIYYSHPRYEKVMGSFHYNTEFMATHSFISVI